MTAPRTLTLSVSAPVGTPMPLRERLTQTGRCPMCGWTEEYPADWPGPWTPLYAVPAQCEWDGTLMERVERGART